MIHDMTKGNVFKAISAFAIPLFIGAVFQQIYNMVDTIVVGNFVGPLALGAVGSCGGIFNLIIALMTGFSGGAGILLAQYFGAKNMKMVKNTFINTILVMLISAIALTIIGLVVAHPFLVLLNTPAEQIDYANTYLTIMCAGIIANGMYNGLSSVLRALGDSITPLIALILSSLLNVGLDLLFVIVFGWGVAGVAIATVLAQIISAIICGIYMLIKIPELRFRFSDIIPDKAIIIDIIKIGVPTALSSVGVSISVMFMQRAINNCGAIAVSGYTIGNKAEQIGMSLSFAIGLSTGMFCGQNIGAQKLDRVRKGFKIGCIVAIAYAVIVTAAFFAFAGPIVGIFTKDPDISLVAKQVIYITMSFSPVLGILFVFQNFLRSAGDIKPTVWMSLIEIFARSILAFIFARIWGQTGIWFVTPIGWTLCTILGIIRYRSGIWKTKAKTA